MEPCSNPRCSAPSAITKWILRLWASSPWDKYNVAKNQLISIERSEKVEEIKKLQKLPTPLPCLLGKHEKYEVPDNLVNSYCMGCGHRLVPFYTFSRDMVDVTGTYWVTEKERTAMSRINY